MRLLPLPGVFQPISDSWMLARCLKRELKPGMSVLDLCTGSGMLAVTAALAGAAVTAVDVSRRAALSVELNAWLNGVDVEVIRGDLFGPLAGRRFDLIVSNPPYVPTPSDELPSSGPGRAWEAGQTGRVFIDRICSQVADHLTPAGRLLMVHSTVCGEQQSLAALSGQGLEAEVVWRHRGRLGPRLRERADWLRQNELLSDEDQDEVIVIRAVSRVPVGHVADRVGSM